MGQITINYTDEQMKAMEYVAFSPQEWIQNAWDNRARKAIHEIVKTYSDLQPEKINLEERLKIVREAKIKTARERHAEMEREIRERQ